MDEYAVEGNPLFICEIRKDALAASCAMYAFFAKNAIGFSPFGIEELALDPAQIEKPPMEVMRALNIDPSAFETEGSREYLKAVYCFAGGIRAAVPEVETHRADAELHAARCRGLWLLSSF
jgi:hypothetical protein